MLIAVLLSLRQHLGHRRPFLAGEHAVLAGLRPQLLLQLLDDIALFLLHLKHDIFILTPVGLVFWRFAGYVTLIFRYVGQLLAKPLQQLIEDAGTLLLRRRREVVLW